MRLWMLGGIVGAVTGPWLWHRPEGLPLALLCAAVFWSFQKRVWMRCAAGTCAGLLLSLSYGGQLLSSRIADECVDIPLGLIGVVASAPDRTALQHGASRQRFYFDVERLAPARCAGPSRILLSVYGGDDIRAGQRWRFGVKLKKPWGRANPVGFNSQSWYAREGVHAVGHVRSGGDQILLGQTSNWRYGHHELRSLISGSLDELDVDSSAREMLRALTIAEDDGLRSDVQRLFRQLGISHLLVISGLHVGMVGALGLLLGRMLVRVIGSLRPWVGWIPAVCALGCAGFYSLLAGFGLPTQRALIMLAVFLCAHRAGLQQQGWNSLLLAAIAVLLLSPFAALGSGFWLSFGAVAALLWYNRWRGGGARRTRLLEVQVFMACVMLPLGAWFFGGGSLVAPLANLVMIPLVALFVVPLALSGVVASLAGAGLAHILWQLAAWPLATFLPLLLAIPPSNLHLPLQGDVLEVGLALFAVCLLVLPGRCRAFALLFILPLLLTNHRGHPDTGADVLLEVFDVGQGTAVFFRSGNRVLLYDTGPGNPSGDTAAATILLPYLRHNGIRVLDTLIVSHGDLDHSAGMDELLAELPVKRVRHGAGQLSDAGSRTCRSGESWRWPGDVRFRVLSPAPGEGAGQRSGDNNGSCVLQIDIAGYRLLLPGDVERGRERGLVEYWHDQLRADWLLVAHHGSATSSSYTLLKHVQPAAAIVSSGYRNSFGHPHPDVVSRLHTTGARLLNTAHGGALRFRIKAGHLVALEPYRDGPRPYWW